MTEHWRVMVDGVEQVSVNPGEDVEIGRRPLRPLADDGHKRLEIDDKTRSMSKRHALFKVNQDGSAEVTDLNSTNGSYRVDAKGLVGLTPHSPLALSMPAVQMQFGDVPLEFVCVDTQEDPDKKIEVSDLFDNATQGPAAEPDMGELSVDDILNLRAGEPTRVFDAGEVAERVRKLNEVDRARRSGNAAAQDQVADGSDSSETERAARTGDGVADTVEAVADNNVAEGQGNAAEAAEERGEASGAHAPSQSADTEDPANEYAEEDGARESAREEQELRAQALEPEGQSDSADSAEDSAEEYSEGVDGLSVNIGVGGDNSADVQSRNLFEDALTSPASPVKSDVSQAEPSRGAEGRSAEGGQSHRGSASQSADGNVQAGRESARLSSLIPKRSDSKQESSSGSSDDAPRSVHVRRSVGRAANRAEGAERRVERDCALEQQHTARQPAIRDMPVAESDKRNAPVEDNQDDDEKYRPHAESRVQEDARETTVFEPGSIFEKVSNGTFDEQEQVIEVEGMSSDEAKKTADFTLQFEMAKHEQLLPFLAMNPSLYDDLYAWLESQGNQDIDMALSHNKGYAKYCDAVGKEL